MMQVVMVYFKELSQDVSGEGEENCENVSHLATPWAKNWTRHLLNIMLEYWTSSRYWV